MRRPKYRLSPNEVERLVKEDQDQRRKLRIIQVREQSKLNAAVIRNDVRREKERLLFNFAAEIEGQLSAEKEEKVRKLEQKYENTLRSIGEGHREAHVHGDGENRAEKLQRQMEEGVAAQERFKQALERQRKEDLDKEYEQTKHILARQAALEKEKKRAAEIASLPPPPPDISVELEKSKKRAVPMTDMKAFATTHYHIPDYHVVRAGSQEQLYDAKSQAQDSNLKLQQDLAEKKRSQHERIERARIRGNEALQKEMLKHEYEDILKDLSLLQKQDRKQRQQKLASIPRQVFLPPEMCMQERRDRQEEMENKFHEILFEQEKLEADQKRDAFMQPASHDKQDTSELGSVATPDTPFSMSRINPALRDVTNYPRHVESPELKKPETVLKQLMNRIKEQKGSHKSVPVTFQEQTAQSTSDIDDQSVILAGSKACWVRAEEDPPLSETKHKKRSRGQKGKQEVDLDMISSNERMIEDLRKRIEQLQAQKEDLARLYQIEAQHHFLTDSEKGQGHHVEYKKDWTLDEVDLDSFRSLEAESDTLEEVDIETVRDVGMERSEEKNVPSNIISSNFDHVLAALNVKSWAGISKEPSSTQLGVPVSQISLPEKLPPKDTMKSQFAGPEQVGGDINVVSKHVDGNVGSSMLRGDFQTTNGQILTWPGSRVGTQEFVAGTGWGTLGGSDMMKGRETDRTTGARRENDFDVEQAGRLSRNLGLSGLVRFDGGDSKLTRFQPELAGALGHHGLAMSTLGYGGQGQGDHRNVGYGVGLARENVDLVRKLREYREKAGEKQASMDPEMIRKVREYQQKLVHIHEERKTLLANIRADIENRRQELHTSVATSGKAVFNVEQIQPRQSVLESQGKASQTAISAGQKMAHNTLGTFAEDGHREWQHVFADTGALAAKFPPLHQLTMGRATVDGSQILGPEVRSSEDTFAVRRQDVETKMVSKKTGGAREREKLDRIRRSLPFDDADETMDASHVSWKDVLDDTAKHSQADDSRLTSSEEERGSPILPKDLSDKSSNSGVVNLSLDGSALLAQAQERKLGFEHRQQELQRHLMDIQQQKDAIMQTYYAGQRALQQRQATLMSKLASASALFSESGREKENNEIRAKLAGVRTQIGMDSMGGATSQGVDHARQFRHPPSDEASFFIRRDESGKALSENRDNESPRPSLASGGNTSSDSFLAEISFRKMRSADKSLPTCASHGLIPGSAPLVATAGNLPETDRQPQTWASLLSSSSASERQPTSLQQVAAQHARLGSQGQFSEYERVEQSILSTGQEETGLKADTSQVSASRSDDLRFPHHTAPSLSPVLGLHDHEPHELSTIVEVDTPASGSALTSARRSLISVPNTAADTARTFDSVSSSQSFSHLPTFRLGSDVRVDVFPELPYTFPVGGASAAGMSDAGYDLTSGHRKSGDLVSRSLASSEPTTAGGQKPLKAKRSLDFSDDLFATAMPALVELTPLKASVVRMLEQERLRGMEKEHEITPEDNYSVGDGESSSLRISGYSDYLRQEERDGKGGVADDESLDVFDPHVIKCDSFVGDDKRNNGEEKDSNFAGGAGNTQAVVGVLQQAQDFKDDVDCLQQRSRAVFDEMSGGGDSTEMSGISLGLSSVTPDLEEVTVSDITEGREDVK